MVRKRREWPQNGGKVRQAMAFCIVRFNGILVSMKILVTGASGLLGRALMRLLAARPDLEVKGVAFSRAKPPLEKLDLTDEDAVARFFAWYRPEVVVHLAAERRPDVVDRELPKAQAINVGATQTIARECARHAAFLLLISTDYVYDGASPPYYPDSPVHPLNAYGRMKLESEYVAERALSGILGPSGGTLPGPCCAFRCCMGPWSRSRSRPSRRWRLPSSLILPERWSTGHSVIRPMSTMFRPQ